MTPGGGGGGGGGGERRHYIHADAGPYNVVMVLLSKKRGSRVRTVDHGDGDTRIPYTLNSSLEHLVLCLRPFSAPFIARNAEVRVHAI